MVITVWIGRFNPTALILFRLIFCDILGFMTSNVTVFTFQLQATHRMALGVPDSMPGGFPVEEHACIQ
jgi:hypothetical protein